MKRITAISLLFCMLFCMCAGADSPSKETPDATVKEGDRLAGTVCVEVYSAVGGEGIALDGKTLNTEKKNDPVFSVTTSSVDYSGSAVMYGGVRIGDVGSSGNFSFPVTNAAAGSVEITFLPALVNGVFAPGKVYGTYNIDDMSLSGAALTLPSGEKIKPSAVKCYYPATGSAELTEKTVTPTSSVSLGDGWNGETGLGGTTPDTPVYCVFVFEIDSQNGSRSASYIDTTMYQDGSHVLTFSDSEKSRDVHVVFDNTPPEITCGITFNQALDVSQPVTFSASDEAGDVKTKVTVNGREYITGEELSKYVDSGKTHSLVIEASDECGNKSYFVTQFTVLSEKSGFTFGKAETDTEIIPQGGTLYALSPLTYDEKTSVGESVYRIAVPAGAEKLLLNYSGTVSTGELITLSVYDNAKQTYTDFLTAASGDMRVAELELNEDIVKDGEVLVRAKAAVAVSESKTLVWVTDTQYYTRYDDLNGTYKSITDYAVGLFAEGKAGYFIHTGDIADEYSPAEKGNAQMKVGSDMQKILEDAGMPYGIVDGNHDVGQSLYDHAIFTRYFGRQRFDSSPAFYGDLNNNVSHYDLVTLGAYDFVFLYLGYGNEADTLTVAWANAVLANYPDRNAVICTHSYLDTDADWVIDETAPEAYTNSRAPEIWEKIVVPNENVVAVFCGHTPGASRNLRPVEGTDREVWEILADYQYAETGDEPCHVLSGISCDGEGYIRLVSFENGIMAQTTYSPYHDDYDYFDTKVDTFNVDIGLSDKRFSLSGTLNAFAVTDAYTAETVLKAGTSYAVVGDYTATHSGASVGTWVIYASIAAVAVAAFFTVVLVAKKKKKQ